MQRKKIKNKPSPGNSLEVQWLGLGTFPAAGPGSIPDWGTKEKQNKTCILQSTSVYLKFENRMFYLGQL